jgi:hypothetical protein
LIRRFLGLKHSEKNARKVRRTGSGFSAQSGGSYVSISGSTVTGAAAGTATIRSNYNTNFSSYQDATITVTVLAKKQENGCV